MTTASPQDLYVAGCDEDEDDQDLRNWRPPTHQHDHGAHAGQHERAALQSLGFQMQLRGKDIAVGNGINAQNGFLDRAVIVQWGVRSYADLWGEHGAGATRARAVVTAAQGRAKVAAASQSLSESLRHREEDMKRYARKRGCRGQCPTDRCCSACAAAIRPRYKCFQCKSLNCRDCVAKGQHEHMAELVRETKLALDGLLRQQSL